MKLARRYVRRKTHAVPKLRFESQTLTSFAGLVIFQKLFAVLGLKQRLSACFRRQQESKIFDRGTGFLQLIVHILLGYRELRDCCHYRHDPLVQRVLGLARLPDVATLSRMLKEATPQSVENLRHLLREMVLDRLPPLALTRVTLDFDGSVQSTRRHAQGTAVGFNKKKKGARSYYPLFCTIAQMGQVFDVLHRPGNVHDSNGARGFILACVDAVRRVAPLAVIEIRMDSAFFSDELVTMLQERGIEFSISVPFERFPELKGLIEERRRWRRLNGKTWYFELSWKPDCWRRRFRFVVIRSRVKRQEKGPIQLDLFVPYEYGYEFKVIVTNKVVGARAVAAFHDGRGSQEGTFAELKSGCHADYAPVRSFYGNQTYLLACLFAHNLAREVQMRTAERSRGTTLGRRALWVFEEVDTIRKRIVRRAGRLTRPCGRLTPTTDGGGLVKRRLLHILATLGKSA